MLTHERAGAPTCAGWWPDQLAGPAEDLVLYVAPDFSTLEKVLEWLNAR